MKKLPFGRSKFNIECNTNALIRKSLESLCLDECGLTEQQTKQIITDEIAMDRGLRIVEQLQNLYRLQNKLILEVGSGIGGLLLQLNLNGIQAYGVEPSAEYTIITEKRFTNYNLKNRCIRATGEFLPFPNNTFDMIISLYVLEHTNNPNLIMQEMIRVLKPGGICHVATPNYFSFREAHYKIFWFPLMPKKLAKLYLKIRGRKTEFFENHITYTTFFSLQRYASKLNIIDLRWKHLEMKIEEKFRNPTLIRSQVKRFIAYLLKIFGLDQAARRLILLRFWLRDSVKPDILLQLQKPNKDGLSLEN